MEDIKLRSEDLKLYKIRLHPEDILVISIPAAWYSRQTGAKKAQRVVKDLEKILRPRGMENIILILPDDMFINKIRVAKIDDPEEIETELEGFEDIEFSL